MIMLRHQHTWLPSLPFSIHSLHSHSNDSITEMEPGSSRSSVCVCVRPVSLFCPFSLPPSYSSSFLLCLPISSLCPPRSRCHYTRARRNERGRGSFFPREQINVVHSNETNSSLTNISPPPPSSRTKGNPSRFIRERPLLAFLCPPCYSFPGLSLSFDPHLSLPTTSPLSLSHHRYYRRLSCHCFLLLRRRSRKEWDERHREREREAK